MGQNKSKLLLDLVKRELGSASEYLVRVDSKEKTIERCFYSIETIGLETAKAYLEYQDLDTQELQQAIDEYRRKREQVQKKLDETYITMTRVFQEIEMLKGLSQQTQDQIEELSNRMKHLQEREEGDKKFLEMLQEENQKEVNRVKRSLEEVPKDEGGDPSSYAERMRTYCNKLINTSWLKVTERFDHAIDAIANASYLLDAMLRKIDAMGHKIKELERKEDIMERRIQRLEDKQNRMEQEMSQRKEDTRDLEKHEHYLIQKKIEDIENQIQHLEKEKEGRLKNIGEVLKDSAFTIISHFKAMEDIFGEALTGDPIRVLDILSDAKDIVERLFDMAEGEETKHIDELIGKLKKQLRALKNVLAEKYRVSLPQE